MKEIKSLKKKKKEKQERRERKGEKKKEKCDLDAHQMWSAKSQMHEFKQFWKWELR